MDLSKLASYITLDPSQLIRAERFVEQGLSMFNLDEELTQQYLNEHLGGKTLEYALQILDENTTSYMGVQIHNQNGSFSAPTAGIYNVKSRPELKSKVKEKVLKRNERENKAERKEEVEVVEEGSLKQARKNVGADKCWKGYKAKGTKTKNGKSVPNCVKEEETEVVNEGDFWHPDPEKDRKLGGPGANQRAREDRAAASKPKEDPKKLRAGESYMQYSKRMKSMKKEEVEQVTEADTSDENRNSPAHRDRSNEGLSDRQIRMKKFAQKRAQMALKKEEVEIVNEEDYDRMKDRQMERGTFRPRSKPGVARSGGSQPKPMPQKKSNTSAFDTVVGELKKKYGDKAIYAKKTTKEEVEELEEKKMSKAAHKKAAKAGKRWQDSDGDGKWYEPGEDVKKEDFNLNDQQYDFLYHQFMSEGFESDEIIEAINESIEEAKVSYGHDTEGPAKKPSFLSKVGKMAKAKLAKVQVKGYNKAREVGQKATDVARRVKQSAKNKIGKTAQKVADRMREETEVEEEVVQLKGKKKGNVIINPEVKKVNEDADASKKMQIQRKQLQLNKQKVALQQKATSKKQPADMHTEENLQEVDATTRSVQYGAEIENTALKRKKEKKSLKTFKQLSKPQSESKE